MHCVCLYSCNGGVSAVIGDRRVFSVHVIQAAVSDGFNNLPTQTLRSALLTIWNEQHNYICHITSSFMVAPVKVGLESCWFFCQGGWFELSFKCLCVLWITVSVTKLIEVTHWDKRSLEFSFSFIEMMLADIQVEPLPCWSEEENSLFWTWPSPFHLASASAGVIALLKITSVHTKTISVRHILISKLF